MGCQCQKLHWGPIVGTILISSIVRMQGTLRLSTQPSLPKEKPTGIWSGQALHSIIPTLQCNVQGAHGRAGGGAAGDTVGTGGVDGRAVARVLAVQAVRLAQARRLSALWTSHWLSARRKRPI